MGVHTPLPYQDWLTAIQDTLDQEVDLQAYPLPAIQKMLKAIELDLISPAERAVMKEEYNQAELEQTKYNQGFEAGKRQAEIAIANC